MGQWVRSHRPSNAVPPRTGLDTSPPVWVPQGTLDGRWRAGRGERTPRIGGSSLPPNRIEVGNQRDRTIAERRQAHQPTSRLWVCARRFIARASRRPRGALLPQDPSAPVCLMSFSWCWAYGLDKCWPFVRVAKLDDSVGWATGLPTDHAALPGLLCAGYRLRRAARLRVVMDAARRMEYRGCDSSGIALVDGGTLTVRRRAGRPNLEKPWRKCRPRRCQLLPAWATPLGHPTVDPTDRNATPRTAGKSPSSTAASSRTSPSCARGWRLPVELPATPIPSRSAPGSAGVSATAGFGRRLRRLRTCRAAPALRHFTLVFANADDPSPRGSPPFHAPGCWASATTRCSSVPTWPRRARRKRSGSARTRPVVMRRRLPDQRFRRWPTSWAHFRPFHIDWDHGCRRGRLRVLHAQGDRRAARRGGRHADSDTSWVAGSCSTSSG